MRNLFFPMFLLAGAIAFSANSQNQFQIRDGDKVVIYGDSITAGFAFQTYPRYVEAYIRTRYPAWTIRVWNRGQSGDVASNLERFRRDCISLSPNVVLFNMGMNDAGYKPSIAPGLRAFSKGISDAATALRENLPDARLILISPILYETRASGALPFYAYVLRCYSMEERDIARRLRIGFIDLDRGYGESIGLAESLFPGISSFSGDGVHPATQGGHLLIAYRILQGLGAGSELASLEIDAANSKILEARGVKTEGLQMKDGVLSFSRTLDSLPFPVVPMTDGIPYCDRSVSLIVDVADSFNRDTLRISGLGAKSYSLSIDGRPVADLAADELADGLNLSRFFNTPDQDQAVAVSEAVGRKHIAQNKLWRLEIDPKTGDAEKRAAEDEVRKAEEALAVVCRPVSHRFTLSPLDREIDRYGRYEQLLEISGPSALSPSEDGSVRQDLTLNIKNLSSLGRHIEFFWSGTGVTPSTKVEDIAGGEQKQVAFQISLKAGEPAPRLAIRHQPSDLSFPPLLQEYAPLLLQRIDAPKAVKAFKPDGDLSEFAGAASIDMENFFVPAILRRRCGPGDFTARAFVQWGDGRLEVAVAVKDQDHTSHFSDGRFSWDDSLVIAVGGASFTLGLAPKGPAILPENAKSRGVQFALVRQGLETIYKISIPRSEFDDKKSGPGSGTPFSITVNDRDRDESHKTLEWKGFLATQKP